MSVIELNGHEKEEELFDVIINNASPPFLVKGMGTEVVHCSTVNKKTRNFLGKKTTNNKKSLIFSFVLFWGFGGPFRVFVPSSLSS